MAQIHLKVDDDVKAGWVDYVENPEHDEAETISELIRKATNKHVHADETRAIEPMIEEAEAEIKETIEREVDEIREYIGQVADEEIDEITVESAMRRVLVDMLIDNDNIRGAVFARQDFPD